MKGREWYQADAVAEAYEDKRFSGGGRLIDRREKRAVLEAMAPVEGKRILEIACGTGRFSVMLAERGATVVGIDISEAMIARGREKARAVAAADRIDLLRGDAARLPFDDGSFDAVFAVRFFHLTDTPVRFLTEMRRVSTGEVFFDTFNATTARTVYSWLLPMGSHLYSRADVDDLFEAAGLRLAGVRHDFVVPYGIYRSLPDGAAHAIRTADTAVLATPLGRQLATVSYWTAAVNGPAPATSVETEAE